AHSTSHTRCELLASLCGFCGCCVCPSMLRQSLLQAKVISFIGKHFSFLFPSMSFASVLTLSLSSLSFLSISLSSSRLSCLPSHSSSLCLSHSCLSLSISLC